MNRARGVKIAKHLFYLSVLLLLYVVQTTPRLFAIGGIKPIWVIPAAVVIAMWEGEFVGGLYGALAGLLCDTGSYALFGFNGFLICAACIAVGLLTIYMVRGNLLGCLAFVLAITLVRGSVDFLFAFGIWASKPGYENVWRIFLFQAIPAALYTTAVAPLVYYPLRAVDRSARKMVEA
jgi:hypothetical protein